jgi:hypothetical protein
MEVKIVITDAGSAAGKTAAVSFESGSGASTGAGGLAAPSAAGASAQAAPSAVGASADQGLSAQDRAGAIDAGPAPSAATFGATGAPEPFVGQRAANVLGPAGGNQSTDESGGAAPGSGAGMETFTTEAQNG